MFAVGGVLRQGAEFFVAVTQDDQVAVVDHCVKVRVEQGRDVGDFRFDVVFVRTMNAGVFDVGVVDAQLEPFADQHFGQFNQRAFTQVIGTGLEAQTEQGDFAFVVAGDDVEGVLYLRFVAAHQ